MAAEWRYEDKIEQMSESDVRERIQAAMDYRIEARILPIPYLAGVSEIVEYASPELTARCPMTGERDFYKIIIRFKPDKTLPELKSLKKYFNGYDDLPISHEHLAAKVYQDFEEAVRPGELGLELHVAVRGGITTVVRVGTEA